MKTLKYFACLCVMVALAGSIWTGCESAEGTDGVDISPASVTLGSGTNSTRTQVFTAKVKGDLALPLEWHVSNTALGHITSSSGANATYLANEGRTGDNVITAKDQYGNEGSAVVMQLRP